MEWLWGDLVAPVGVLVGVLFIVGVLCTVSRVL